MHYYILTMPPSPVDPEATIIPETIEISATERRILDERYVGCNEEFRVANVKKWHEKKNSEYYKNTLEIGKESFKIVGLLSLLYEHSDEYIMSDFNDADELFKINPTCGVTTEYDYKYKILTIRTIGSNILERFTVRITEDTDRAFKELCRYFTPTQSCIYMTIQEAIRLRYATEKYIMFLMED